MIFGMMIRIWEKKIRPKSELHFNRLRMHESSNFSAVSKPSTFLKPLIIHNNHPVNIWISHNGNVLRLKQFKVIYNSQ